MAKHRATTFVWTGLEGRFTRASDAGASFAPASYEPGAIEEFWLYADQIGKVLYSDGTWQQSGPLKPNKPIVELQLAERVAKQRGLA